MEKSHLNKYLAGGWEEIDVVFVLTSTNIMYVLPLPSSLAYLSFLNSRKCFPQYIFSGWIRTQIVYNSPFDDFDKKI
jgi:hypothetical protein